MPYQKTLFVICFLTIILICFLKCSNHSSSSNDPRGGLYAGSQTCISCHKNIADSYFHNNHFKTSGKASYSALKNLIDSANSTINFINNQKIVLTEKDTSFFQSYLENNQMIRSERMDIAFGSAEKAQTFAYWNNHQLFQLPLTYLTSSNTWTNSPGFPIDKPYFTRVIPSRCLECHTSYVKVTEEREGTLLKVDEKFDPNTIIFGIDCERCHGPAEKHVQFHQENPDFKTAKFITSIKSLSRQQQVDLCGTCHSGNPVTLNSIFAFTPGDTLSKYYLFYSAGKFDPDVHGMQLQSLQLSKCYQQSMMTCMTCHEPHQSVKDNQIMINKCVSCHTQSEHAIQMKTEKQNCISCHMPLRPSRSLDFNNETQGNNIPYMLRTHRIAIYKTSEIK